MDFQIVIVSRVERPVRSNVGVVRLKCKRVAPKAFIRGAQCCMREIFLGCDAADANISCDSSQTLQWWANCGGEKRRKKITMGQKW